MDRIARVLAELKSLSPVWRAEEMPELLDVERYVDGGDPAVLASLRDVGRLSHRWQTLVDALGRPDRWSARDRRLVHVVARVGALEQLGAWLDRQLETELEGADLFRPVARELILAGVCERLLCGLLVGKVLRLESRQGPNSAGRFLLAAPVSDLVEAVERRVDWRSSCTLGSFCRLTRHFEPQRACALFEGLR